MLKQMFDQVREKSPLIHNITNYVTVNARPAALFPIRKIATG